MDTLNEPGRVPPISHLDGIQNLVENLVRYGNRLEPWETVNHSYLLTLKLIPEEVRSLWALKWGVI